MSVWKREVRDGADTTMTNLQGRATDEAILDGCDYELGGAATHPRPCMTPEWPCHPHAQQAKEPGDGRLSL